MLAQQPPPHPHPLYKKGSISRHCQNLSPPHLKLVLQYGYVGKGREAMLTLKHEVLHCTLLRRTKVQQADVLALPPR